MIQLFFFLFHKVLEEGIWNVEMLNIKKEKSLMMNLMRFEGKIITMLSSIELFDKKQAGLKFLKSQDMEFSMLKSYKLKHPKLSLDKTYHSHYADYYFMSVQRTLFFKGFDCKK